LQRLPDQEARQQLRMLLAMLSRRTF
jgi:hypothetical protein